MKPRVRMLGVLAGALLLAAACGGGDDPGLQGTAPPDAQSTSTPDDGGLQKSLVASDSEHGSILTIDGTTLYVFTRDEPGKSNCTGQCATIWPPLETGDGIAVGEGVDESKLGTVEGSEHVTYNGRPLYFYSQDKEAGDTNGQGAGGNWFVVGPEGEPVK